MINMSLLLTGASLSKDEIIYHIQKNYKLPLQ